MNTHQMTPTPRTDVAQFGKGRLSVELQLERDIAELNERLIDRQKTLMETLIENQNLRRELDKAMHYNQ